MASTALVRAEGLVKHLEPLEEEFKAMLTGTGLTARKVRAAITFSFVRAIEAGNTALLECSQPSIMLCAMTAVDLALLPDSATGQFFMLPFKKRGVYQAVPCIGYKGYNTLGAREGLTITGEVVWSGDAFDFDLGEGWVKHKPVPRRERKSGDRLIGAWAKAAAFDRPSIVAWMPIDDINELRAKNPAVMAGRESPWNTHFEAMASKCPKRRLSRSLPIGAFVRAARIEEAFEEQGQIAYSRAGNVLVGGAPSRLVRESVPEITTQRRKKGPAETPDSKAPQLALEQPKPEAQKPLGTPKKREFIFRIGRGPKQSKSCHSIEQWRQVAKATILQLQGDNRYSAEEKLERVRDIMGPIFDELSPDYPEQVADVVNALDRRLKDD